MLGFTVPPQLILGQSAALECNFDLEGSKLYSVKWYKNGQEFYRFMPGMDRQYDVFDVAGVNIDVSFQKFHQLIRKQARVNLFVKAKLYSGWIL